jgi:hypothetical protein
MTPRRDTPHHPLPLPVTPAARRERSRRVALLADLVRRGRYRIPAEAVAEAILREITATRP